MEIVLFLLILGLAMHDLNLRSRLEELSERVQLLEFPKAVPVAHAPPAVVVTPPVAPPPLPRFEPRPAAPRPEPVVEGPSLSDRIRTLLGNEEWESLIGGSILNKLGALVLVIGIALFLGFSVEYMNPAGRAALALAVSAGILGAGVWVERRDRYRIFARGLIGAGWAGLYATTYASYAIPAAQVIPNSFAGSALLLAVGTGMIAHSLRYRAQAVTAVAYFSAFAALAVTPSSPFAVIGVIPLAASVLYLAVRFEWYSMALFGLVATYLTCISRGSSDAPLAEVQALFLVYWLLFELFDLIRVQRRIVKGGVEFLYYGNLAGFVGLSYMAWAHHAPGELWIASAVGSAIFLVDAAARAVLRPSSSFEATDGVPERLEAGTFEVSALVSALLAGASLVANVSGVWLSAGLAIEAEAVYLLGVRFASPFLRYLGLAAFGHSLVRLGMLHARLEAVPPLVFHAVLFYVNRVVRRPNALMSWAAALAGALAIGIETQHEWRGCGWIVFAVVLLEVGIRAGASDFRLQAYLIGSAGAVAQILWGGAPGLALGTVLVYGCAVRSKWLDKIEERDDFATAASGIAAAMAFLWIWRGVPVEYAGLSWFGLALAVVELGNQRLPAQMRLFAGPFGALALLGLALTHGGDFVHDPAQAVWISFFGSGVIAAVCAVRSEAYPRQGFVAASTALTMAGIWMVTPEPYVTIAWTVVALAVLELRFRVVAAAAFALIYGRMMLVDLDQPALLSMPAAIAGVYWLWFRVQDLDVLSRAVFWLAPAPLLALLLKTVGISNTAPEFMVISLALLAAGIRFGIRDARIQSYIVGAAAFGLGLGPRSLWIPAVTAALLYVGQLMARESAEWQASACFSTGGTLLLGELLFEQASGGSLTVSWGFEGLALLAAGFILRERVLRLEGLAVLLVCILKLFFYDLRNLETLPRILSFIALGAIMLGVSWIYTRFRDHVKRLL